MSQNVSTPGSVPLDDGFPPPTYTATPTSSPSTKDVAKDQAAGVGQSAAGAGQHVASVAKGEAQNVAGEAVHQAKDLLGQARGELAEQAAQQQQRVADGLRSLSQELTSMADGNQDAGIATDLARQAATRTGDLAGWLEQRDPNGLLDDVKTFARRRPGAFLAIALGAGLAAGRLTRGLKDDSSSGSGSASAPASPSPAVRPANSPVTDDSLYGRAETTPVELVPSDAPGYPVASPAPATGQYGEQGYRP